jgi:hypothetical protein
MISNNVSKPIVITSVIVLFAGSSVGCIWMMSIFGIEMPQLLLKVIVNHPPLQMNGFLTLLIMGIGYMIIPRFRNIPIPSITLAYISFFLVVASLVLQLAIPYTTTYENGASIWFVLFMILRLSGLVIFAALIFSTLKVKPKLLRLSDYFLALAIITLLSVNAVDLIHPSMAGFSLDNDSIDRYATADLLTSLELWLLFPVITIYGIEYKTLPSFLGFIRPNSTFGIVSLIMSSVSVALGVVSLFLPDSSMLLPLVFNILFFISSVTFALSVYAFGGFDNTEIKRLIQGEKKARYNFTTLHIKVSFLFLFIGISMALLFDFEAIFHQQYHFILYDLAIHVIAIGFIGTTITLYFPLMLPPILKKAINFLDFNKMPIILITLSLCLRGLADFMLIPNNSVFSFSSLQESMWSPLSVALRYTLGLSGWLVVVAMFVFVGMLHKSMNKAPSL